MEPSPKTHEIESSGVIPPFWTTALMADSSSWDRPDPWAQPPALNTQSLTWLHSRSKVQHLQHVKQSPRDHPEPMDRTALSQRGSTIQEPETSHWPPQSWIALPRRGSTAQVAERRGRGRVHKVPATSPPPDYHHHQTSRNTLQGQTHQGRAQGGRVLQYLSLILPPDKVTVIKKSNWSLPVLITMQNVNGGVSTKIVKELNWHAC